MTSNVVRRRARYRAAHLSAIFAWSFAGSFTTSWEIGLLAGLGVFVGYAIADAERTPPPLPRQGCTAACSEHHTLSWPCELAR